MTILGEFKIILKRDTDGCNRTISVFEVESAYDAALLLVMAQEFINVTRAKFIKDKMLMKASGDSLSTPEEP